MYDSSLIEVRNMNIKSYVFGGLIVYILQILVVVKCNEVSDNPLLLLVSFDGFRWDYLHRSNLNLTNFNRLKATGSYADYIYNSVATLTFPNHWTLVTGLHQESHGIVHNYMFDKTLNKTFEIKRRKESFTVEWFGQNKQVEPIWAVNQKAGQNRRSAAEWVGSEVTFDHQNITYIPYNSSTPFVELVDKFISLFVDPNGPINFGALYFDQPDNFGHIYGPESNEVNAKLQELDSLVGYLLKQIESHNLTNRLNLIITSDHGMESTPESNSVFLNQYVDLDQFDVVGNRVFMNIFLKNDSQLENIHQQLKKVSHIYVFKKNEVPDSFHYKNNVRIGDILLIGEQGYSIFLQNNSISYLKGNHGYLNNKTASSMYPIFLANGPAFKRNFKVESFYIEDVYQIMCAVLQVQAGANNGSFENIKAMLSESVIEFYNKKHIPFWYSLIALTPIVSAAITAVVLYLVSKRQVLPGQESLNDGYMMLSTSELVKMDDTDSLSLEEININV